MAETEPQVGIPQVKDKRPKISGLLPKNAQARVLGGVAALMVLVIAFSGRKSPPTKPATLTTSTMAAVDPNQARIQEYRSRIEDQARQLAVEEAELSQTKQAFGAHPASPGVQTGQPLFRQDPGMPPPYRMEPEKSPIELDRQKREYQGLFASNIALTYRHATPLPASPGVETPASAGAPAGAAVPSSQAPARKEPEFSADSDATAPQKYRLFEGTVLETVLTNRLDSSFSGPVNCMATTDVYSHDHQTLLVPQGTRVLGEVRKLESFGEQRLAVTFHRMIMPDGYSVNLDQFKALNQIGETGLRDQVNHHYLQIFGVSIAIGAIAGLAQASANYGQDPSAGDVYAQGVATSMARTSLHILDRYLNVLPTFTIREGHRIKVYLAQDLLLPAYAQHQMPGDL